MRTIPIVMSAAILLVPSTASADTFGSGANEFEIEFVTIGSPGNAADTTGEPNPAGGVDYVYRIGKYEVPEHAIRRANALSAAAGNPLGITIDDRGPDKPATRVSWFEAARFVNWLNEDKGATPAYKFDANSEFQLWEPSDPGYDPDNLFRNSQARYFLPSVDEWYKAAFYDPVSETWFDYPNGMNTPPIAVAGGTAANTAVYDQPFTQGPADVMFAGGASPFGTVSQAGNVWEWEETAVDLMNDDPDETHGLRGTSWSDDAVNTVGLSSSFRGIGQLPSNSLANVGTRIAAKVPEPTTFYLAVLVFVKAANFRRMRLKRGSNQRILAEHSRS